MPKQGLARLYLIRPESRKDEGGHPGFRGFMSLADGCIHIDPDNMEYLGDGDEDWMVVDAVDTISIPLAQIESIEWGAPSAEWARFIADRKPDPPPPPMRGES